jgi:acyl-CoA dehydrogenase
MAIVRMDFELPARSAALISPVRSFIREEVMPLERQAAADGWEAVVPKLELLRGRVKALGWWAPTLPRAYGGMGLSLLEFAFVGEELGRTPLGHYCFNCQAPDVGNMEVLLLHGSDALKARYLAPLARGDVRSCFSMTERDRPGSNPTWLSTTARREGDNYVVDGRKWFTSSADGAAFAIVMAVTNPDAPSAHLRASQIVVPTTTPGFTRVRNIPVMGEAGGGYASHAEVAYEGCRVPVENRLGEEGAGFAIAQDRLGPGRVHHCVRWLGICERALELMCERATRRELSPGKPLSTRHVLQEWIAQARAEINAARLMVLQAAWRLDREGALGAREDISLIKFFAADVLTRTLDRAIQVHGALGLTDETPLAAWYCHERAAHIYDGPDEVHRAAVAKRILRAYGGGKT